MSPHELNFFLTIFLYCLTFLAIYHHKILPSLTLLCVKFSEGGWWWKSGKETYFDIVSRFTSMPVTWPNFVSVKVVLGGFRVGLIDARAVLAYARKDYSGVWSIVASPYFNILFLLSLRVCLTLETPLYIYYKYVHINIPNISWWLSGWMLRCAHIRKPRSTQSRYK